MDISRMTINEIKNLFNNKFEISTELLVAVQSDNRAGVRKIFEQLIKQKEKMAREMVRLEKMQKYEEEIYGHGYNLIAGIDEAGRGPLAGPVVAAAVVLPRGIKIIGINDSKKLSAEKRNELVQEIKSKAIAWSVSLVDAAFIDKFNILQASLRAMYQSVKLLKSAPDYLLVDAVKIPHLDIPQLPIISGDSLSSSIAAASIVAKTTRDKMMADFHNQYPQYGFDKHKGYGTTEHVLALEKHGPCPIHRLSFNLVKQYA